MTLSIVHTGTLSNPGQVQPGIRQYDDLAQFLNLMETPVGMRGLVLAAPLADQAMALLLRSTDPEVRRWAERWKGAAELLVEIVDLNSEALPDAHSVRLRTLCESNPIYAAMLCAASVATLGSAGLLVLSYLFYSLARDHDQLSVQQIGQAGRAYRYLITNPIGLKVLELVSTETSDPTQLAADIEQAMHVADNESVTCENYVELIQRVLRGKARRGRPIGGRCRGPGGGAGLHGENAHTPVDVQTIIVPDDEEASICPGYSEVADNGEALLFLDGLRSGLARRELSRAVSLDGDPTDTQGIPLARDAGSRARRARDASDFVATHNRMFSWQWTQLSAYEVYLVHDWALRVLCRSETDRQTRQTVLIVMTSFYLSQTPEKTALLRWCLDAEDKDRSNHTFIARGRHGWHGIYYRPALTPSQNAALSHVRRDLLLKTSPRV